MATLKYPHYFVELLVKLPDVQLSEVANKLFQSLLADNLVVTLFVEASFWW